MVKNSEKISVLIPSYNHSKYLHKTIESVLQQSYPNFELLIYDDCSTDDSKKVINSFKDERIKACFYYKNVGTVRNLNRLIADATGDYIAILGSDDIWKPEKLEKQLSFLQSNPQIAACFTWAEVIDNNGDICSDSDVAKQVFNVSFENQGEWIKAFYDSGNHICHSSVLIRKTIQDELGAYNIAYRQLHDFDFWTRLILKHPIHILKEELVLYRRDINNKSSVSSNEQKNIVRLCNETKDIVYKMIMDMPKSLYYEGFCGGENCNLSELDLLVEKFKLLCDFNAFDNTSCLLANRFLFENGSPQIIEKIESSLNISLNELYEKTAKNQDYYCTGCKWFDNEKMRFDAEISNLNVQLSAVSSELERVYNSKSWKLSKPIRLLGEITKKLRREK